MRNIALFIMLFFLNSCSFNNLFLSEEIDTVTVVKYTPYMKHHRAYFTRTHLKTIVGNQRYRFLYNTKKQELGILLHRKNQWLLYNFTKPKTPIIAINEKSKISYKTALRTLKREGYVPKSLNALGYAPTIALRRYKGVKTIMVEVKDYRRLKKLYANAIKTYQAKEIRSIKTVLPKDLIYAHYEKYRKRARTAKHLGQLQLIANKLDFNSNIPKKKSVQTAKKSFEKEKVEEPQPVIKETVVEEKISEKKVSEEVTFKKEPTKEVYTPPKQATKGYKYYRYHASYNELRRYLSKPDTGSSLSYKQYRSLQQHAKKLKEERLLEQGSLEELIAAYKVNNNPKYKQRIMILMKDKQLNQ